MENKAISLTSVVFCAPGDACRTIRLQVKSMFRQEAVRVRKQSNSWGFRSRRRTAPAQVSIGSKSRSPQSIERITT